MTVSVSQDLHVNNEQHHHHSHAAQSVHPGGHHLLQVSNLSVSFLMYDSSASFFSAPEVRSYALKNLSVSVHEGELLAVVGASGSGKSLLVGSILGLYEPNAFVDGEIWFDGNRLVEQKDFEAVRGSQIALIPQSVNALDPLVRVGKQIEEFCTDPQNASNRRNKLFERYSLAEEVAQMYPHQLSGGMARRVLLCCALINDPKLILADEPTPGLDLDLAETALSDLRACANKGCGVLLITHDIELALRVADRIAIFKDGSIIEETSTEAFKQAQGLRDPFTRALRAALPSNAFLDFRSEVGLC